MKTKETIPTGMYIEEIQEFLVDHSETYLNVIIDGEETTLTFNTIELLETIDIDHLKKHAYKYILSL